MSFGPIRIPPLPHCIRLEDRAVPGKYWKITHNKALGLVGISDAAPDSQEKHNTVDYEAFTGPVLYTDRAGMVRLLVRNGFLGFEDFTSQGQTDGSVRVQTRVGTDRYMLEVMDLSATQSQQPSLRQTPLTPGWRVVQE